MLEQLSYLRNAISLTHLNILFLLGLALFGGTVGGRLFQKLRIPQVVGYIVIGICIGESGLQIVGHQTIQSFQPFSYFALGLIGFMIGGELKREVLQKYGRQFMNILLFEGLAAFLAVSVSVGVIGTLLFADWRFAWALGLLLGAIASATAPAATTEVLREYKSRGPLTRTVTGIVALDDGLALLLFALAASLAGSLSGGGGSILRRFIHPLYEISGSMAIGIIGGLVLSRLLKKYSEEKRLLAFSIGMVLLVAGFSLAVHVDMLLAAMSLGVIVVNFTPRKSKDIFKLVDGFTAPIYVLFFVLVGAKLNINQMTLPIIILGCVYLFGRSAGKTIGANFGARISGAPKSVRKYLPWCLLGQAGVAIGLSILAGAYFPGRIGNAVVIIITATTFILELIGPAFVKVALSRSGEIGLNITEADLIDRTCAGEVMDKDPPLIYKNMPLAEILRIFSESSNLYYPVVDNEKKLLGVITVDSIKNIFMEADLKDLLLAVDVMEPAVAEVEENSTLSSVRESLNRHHLEYLPVIKKDNILVGFIEERMLDKFISTKIVELQRRSDFLESE
ncbi:cation:proton antiporter [Candidatus Omnitrophota bacterium]